MKDSFIFSSNSIKLSWKNWLLAIAIIIVITYSLPVVWKWLERFEPQDNYRLPYSLSDDYWMFGRWSEYACSKYPVLIIGDSVIWGEYTNMDQTLPGCLNKKAEKTIFANLGVDGTHPGAISGLIKYYGKAISNKPVILHLNPLWMSSDRHDLSGKGEFRFNHPRLVPQFINKPACYKPTFSQRMGILMERGISFFSWSNHIRTIYFEGVDLRNWTMEHPYTNPIKAITLTLPAPENSPKSEPVVWTEKEIEKQDFPWVNLSESFQWRSFKEVIETLKSRKNKIFIIIGPFNPYILSEESLKRYKIIKKEIEDYFTGSEIDYYSIQDLPSDLYADASHPLKDGYARIAEELFQTPSFRNWLGRF